MIRNAGTIVRTKKLSVLLMMALLLLGLSAMGGTAFAKESPTKTEIVQYATGPGGETDPELLGERKIQAKKPDSDGVAAVKTAGAFVIDFVTLPLQIVKVFWESVTE